MTMQRRHFELIAETIAELPANGNQRYVVAHQFARKLRATNPQFNEARFLRACGVE
jgi:hypothetical protein